LSWFRVKCLLCVPFLVLIFLLGAGQAGPCGEDSSQDERVTQILGGAGPTLLIRPWGNSHCRRLARQLRRGMSPSPSRQEGGVFLKSVLAMWTSELKSCQADFTLVCVLGKTV